MWILILIVVQLSDGIEFEAGIRGDRQDFRENFGQ